jgi:hypothetical protein
VSHDPQVDPPLAGAPGVASEEGESLPLDATLRAIESEFHAMMGRPQQVAEACGKLLGKMEESAAPSSLPYLLRLVPMLSRRQGPLAQALFDFLRQETLRCPNPEPLVPGLLLARDSGVRLGALGVVLDLLRDGRLAMSMELALAMAEAVEAGEGLDPEPGVMEALHDALNRLPCPEDADEGPVVALWVEAPQPSLRRMAARILDRGGEPVPDHRARRLLGEVGFAFLSPYLSFTRASHLDLLHLSPGPRELSPGFHSLEAAEGLLGRKLLGDLIGSLGWSRLTWGLEVRPAHGVAVEGSWPLLVTPHEADLLLGFDGARRLWKRFLVVVHGGSAERATRGGAEDGAMDRFRRYNVAHAEVLAELMEVAPLTAGKVRRILEKMQGIVEDFEGLFHGATDDASRLPGVFAALRTAVEKALGEASGQQTLSPEVTRLVQMFEDPERLDDVRTVHGLKRYLHQRGLRLAFKLFRSGRTTNRFVDLVLTSQHQVLEVVQRIRYIEFEPDPARDPGELPFAVALLAEALGRQLLYGERRFPDVEVLGYGTEVQVFIRFRNHPVFLRIDLSPPLRGGMIDLEYFGVSQYEMEHHPDLTLAGIRRLFRRLDFDVTVEGLRLHVRYDKERALDLGDLLGKIRVLFPLLPYLMDFDWILGGLDYPDSVKELVAEAWADFLLRWGVLPTEALLTSDRRKVLRGVHPDPAGDREVHWDGRGTYRDRFAGLPDERFWDELRTVLDPWGLGRVARWEEAAGAGPGQIPLERVALNPLREAVARGEIRRATVGLSPVPPGQFQRVHPADRVAEVLADGGHGLREAASLATLVGSVERHLRFQVAGSVNGHPVQQAVLPIQGERVTLFLLRDLRGVGCLALGARGDALYRRRSDPSLPWERGGELGWEGLMGLLRGNNYLASAVTPAGLLDDDAVESMVRELRNPSPAPLARSWPGERVIPGLAAAPGRAAGFVCFPVQHHSPGAADILFAPAVRPQDAPLLRQAAGIVSTGGGALSHAGLVALELGKPALILQGRWESDRGGTLSFVCRRPVYAEEEDRVAGLPVTRRLDLREEEECLRGGELVVVDADGESLTILGDGRDALAVHQELHHLEEVTGELAVAVAGFESLTLRGRLLRTTHQLQKLLARITDPALARHAVRQLLLGDAARYVPARQVRQGVLESLFQNPACGAMAREAAGSLAREMSGRLDALFRAAVDAVTTSRDLFEILFLRRDVLRVDRTLVEIRALLEGAVGQTSHEPAAPSRDPYDSVAPGAAGILDTRVRERLEDLGSEYHTRAKALAADAERLWLLGHLVDGTDRIDALLGRLPDPMGRDDLEAWRDGRVESLSTRYIITPGDGGRELSPLVGSKAANLGEVVRILGPERVPSWFALTERAFRVALDSGVCERGRESAGRGDGMAPLGRAIQEALERPDLDPVRKSAVIQDLWRRVRLPEDLEEEILSAYSRLGPEGRSVSIRSSAFEEDTERGAWAGAFDTFLFVQGQEALLELVKRAWAGMWTERAIRLRQAQGISEQPCGGGLIVQRMVKARVSGVVHTVSTATRQLRDVVVNVGLGLGEGVVSGTVEVDHILVSKEGDPLRDSLRFQYRVGDKREQVVFDVTSGQGTRRVDTLYHQRLRPALEYVELLELVRSTLALEAVYGHPLDLEFAMEGQDLFVLQVRPIPLFHSLMAEILERFPLSIQPGKDSEVPR